MTTKPKKRNPTDLTGRNNNARKKEMLALTDRVAVLEAAITRLAVYLHTTLGDSAVRAVLKDVRRAKEKK